MQRQCPRSPESPFGARDERGHRAWVGRTSEVDPLNRTRGPRSDFAGRTTVRWADAGPLGHAHHTAVLHAADPARLSFVRTTGLDPVPVVDIRAQYLAKVCPGREMLARLTDTRPCEVGVQQMITVAVGDKVAATVTAEQRRGTEQVVKAVASWHEYAG